MEPRLLAKILDWTQDSGRRFQSKRSGFSTGFYRIFCQDTSQHQKEKKTRNKFVYKKEPIVGLWCKVLPHHPLCTRSHQSLTKKISKGGYKPPQPVVNILKERFPILSLQTVLTVMSFYHRKSVIISPKGGSMDPGSMFCPLPISFDYMYVSFP